MISLIIPVFNGAELLEKSLEKVESQLEKITRSYEIIIAEDGSTDGTDRIAIWLAKANPKIKVLQSRKRKGKGRAIKDAFVRSKGDILAFTDVDLSSNLKHLPQLIAEIKEGADICIGSRLLPNSKVERDFYRSLASKSYNYLVRMLFGTKIADFQCGFKSFRRSSLPTLLSSKSNHWFWDTEMLLIAERNGLKISQIPIEWRETSASKLRILNDTLAMGANLIRLKFRMLIGNVQ
jgi:glycosyltransferase involved in cell wall biosynthesis